MIQLRKTLTLSLALLGIIGFGASCSANPSPSDEGQSSNEIKKYITIDTTGLKSAHFASGCFWCVEAVYESVKGVKEVYNGYAGGHTKNPTYEDSNTGKTGHAETVEVWYDPKVISFKTLVDVHFGSQNIEQVNGQGPDNGSQYRSIVFYDNAEEKKIIDAKIKALESEGFKVASEVMEHERFWMGEDYHQNYERLHPDNGYIMAISLPRLNKFKAKFPDILKEESH